MGRVRAGVDVDGFRQPPSGVLPDDVRTLHVLSPLTRPTCAPLSHVFASASIAREISLLCSVLPAALPLPSLNCLHACEKLQLAVYREEWRKRGT